MNLDEIKRKKISAISLGCDKNRVDLEKMLYNLKSFGFEIIDNIEDAEIIIVNTCAFIQSAVSEAIDNILLALEQKASKCEKVIVTGCLFSRYGEEIKQSLSEVDAYVDIKNNSKIVDIVCNLYNAEIKHVYKEGRLLTNYPHYAYLKIADGCNNGCAYCTIPRIRGRYISTPLENLIKEAKMLASQGVKELILVAQDVTRYGYDIYNESRLVQLIRELSRIKEISWIRLHYCYPEMVTNELLDEIKLNPKVCKYLDIPLQHIDDKILKDMNRRSDEASVRMLIQNLKENYPEITIRSTFIVGFPGESGKQFKKLIQFLKQAQLNNVGFFPYYKEEKTKAFFMKKQVPSFIKKMRLKKAQKVQTQIANDLNLKLVGNTVDVLIDYFDYNDGYFYGRSQASSPNVDFYISFDNSQNIVLGNIYKAKILSFENGVFKGEIIKWTYLTNFHF